MNQNKKYQLTQIVDNVNCAIKEFNTVAGAISSLIKAVPIKGEMWSPAVYKDFYKNSDNWVSHPSFFSIDIDDTLTMKDAAARCEALRLNYAILPTRNNQKPKHGVLADRYRVVFVLSEPITTEDKFRGTWDYVKSLFPMLDPACCDVGRGYFHSTSIFKTNYTLNDLVPVAAEMKKYVPLVSQLSGEKGSLSKKTLQLLYEGAKQGSRDTAIHNAARNYVSNNFTEEECLEDLLKAPHEYSSDFTEDDLIAKVRYVYTKKDTKHPFIPKEVEEIESTLKQFIRKSKTVKDILDIRMPVLINTEALRREEIAERVIRETMGKEYHRYATTNVFQCKYVYNPENAFIISTDPHGIASYNLYQPPEWQRLSFYGKEDAPVPVLQVPAIVDRFLKHLIADDVESYEYLLDWLATAVQGRNRTVLTMLGNEGVGKGTLADLMRNVFGNTNFNKVRASFFKGRFNSAIENKRLVLLDELKLSTPEEYALFRDLVNDEVEVEAKGIDSRLVKNYCNFLLASNELDAIKPPPDDRRFSIINLNTVNISTTSLLPHLSEIQNDKELASQFARYLLYRKPKYPMHKPFKSKAKSEEVREAGLTDWEHYVIYELLEELQGKTIPFKDLGVRITIGCRITRPPGRVKLERLIMRFPQYVKLTLEKGTNNRCMTVVGYPKVETGAKYEEITLGVGGRAV